MPDTDCVLHSQFTLCRSDRNSQGGGVDIASRRDVDFYKIPDALIISGLEIIHVKILNTNFDLRVIFIYKVPSVYLGQDD